MKATDSRKGGIARARRLTSRERSESARHAVRSRWTVRNVLDDRRWGERMRMIDAARGMSPSERLLACVELTRATAEFAAAAKKKLPS